MTPADYVRLAVLVLLVLLFPAGFVTGCVYRAEQAKSYEDAVEREGKRAEKLRGERVAQQLKDQQEVRDELRKKIEELERRRAPAVAGMRADARRGVVAGAAAAAPGGQGAGDKGALTDAACFSRDNLDRRIQLALDNFLGGVAPVLQRGDAALAALGACLSHDERVGRLRPLTQ